MNEPRRHRPAGERARLKEALVAIGLALAGAALLWFALAGLIPFVRGIGARAPLVDFSVLDARALFAALAAFSLAILLAAPSSGGRRGAAPDRRTVRWVGAWLTVGVVFALAALVAGPIAQGAATALATHGGYRPCPAARDWEHHPTQHWVQDGGRCP